MSISVVCFDMYGTLLDLDALRETVEQYTPMAEAFCAEWRKRQLQLTNVANANSRYLNFDRITLMALHELAPRFRLRLTAADQKRLVDAWAALPAFPDVLSSFEIVRERWMPVVVLTNGVGSTARNALEHAGVLDRVDTILSADEVKVFKPSPAVYALVLRTGIKPENVLFLSANDWDASGARQAGFRSIWVNRRRSVASSKHERTIGSLLEIGNILTEFSPL